MRNNGANRRARDERPVFDDKATSIDRWIADLLDKPEKKRAESLYELLLRLNLSMSHLDDVHEAHVRRLGLR